MQEKWITPMDSEKIRSKLVVLEPGEEVGEHITQDREEVLVVLEGEATIIIEGETRELNGKAVYIGKNKKHNVLNNSDKALKYVYVTALHK